MSVHSRQMLAIYHKFLDQQEGTVVDASELGMWAIRNGKYKVEDSAILSKFKEDLARILRGEYIIDSRGRKARAKHVVVQNRNGKQMSFWGDIRTAPREHMRKSFQQRRHQIAGGCRQLKTDLDSYNEDFNSGKQLDLGFDFTNDLREAELARSGALPLEKNPRKPMARLPRLRRLPTAPPPTSAT